MCVSSIGSAVFGKKDRVSILTAFSLSYVSRVKSRVLSRTIMFKRLYWINYTGLQGFVVGKLWVVSGEIFDVESVSGIRISLPRQDFEIFEVMCSKNGGFLYF